MATDIGWGDLILDIRRPFVKGSLYVGKVETLHFDKTHTRN
jgi:hypothetical protein